MTREYNHTVPFDKNYKESINPQLNDDELERLIDLVETNNQYNEDDDDIFFWNVVASKLSLLKV